MSYISAQRLPGKTCPAGSAGLVYGAAAMKRLAIIVFVTSLFLGCKQDPPPIQPSAEPMAVHQPKAPASAPMHAGSATANTLPPGHPPVGDKAPKPTGDVDPGTTISGTVLETIPAGKYLYLKLDRAEGETWAAVLKADIKQGQAVGIVNAHLMERFRSPSLDRTFDAIWFGTLGKKSSEVAKTAASTPKPEAAPTKVAPAASGVTVQAIHQKKADLAGKSVTVSGKVVKFNAQIMGKNWIHLQDGTGTKAAGDHDILVTGNFTTKVGDTITVTGAVAVDRDFGHGYSYAVLVEKATLNGAE